MTSKKISELVAATTASGADAPVVQGGVTKKLPLSLLLSASDAPEVIRDVIAATLVGGANVTITPDDVNDTVTVIAADTGAETMDELSDVNTTGVAINDTLSWDGVAWVPVSSGVSYGTQDGSPLAPASTAYEVIPGCAPVFDDVPLGSLLWIMAESAMQVTTGSVQVGLRLLENGVAVTGSTIQVLSSSSTAGETRKTLNTNTAGTTGGLTAGSAYIIPVSSDSDVTVQLLAKQGATTTGAQVSNARIWVALMPAKAV